MFSLLCLQMRWLCKTCTFSATSRGDLLTHYILQHTGPLKLEIWYLVLFMIAHAPLELWVPYAHIFQDIIQKMKLEEQMQLTVSHVQFAQLHLGNHLRRHETVQCVFAECLFKTNVYVTLFSRKVESTGRIHFTTLGQMSSVTTELCPMKPLTQMTMIVKIPSVVLQWIFRMTFNKELAYCSWSWKMCTMFLPNVLIILYTQHLIH